MAFRTFHFTDEVASLPLKYQFTVPFSCSGTPIDVVDLTWTKAFPIDTVCTYYGNIVAGDVQGAWSHRWAASPTTDPCYLNTHYVQWTSSPLCNPGDSWNLTVSCPYDSDGPVAFDPVPHLLLTVFFWPDGGGPGVGGTVQSPTLIGPGATVVNTIAIPARTRGYLSIYIHWSAVPAPWLRIYSTGTLTVRPLLSLAEPDPVPSSPIAVGKIGNSYKDTDDVHLLQTAAATQFVFDPLADPPDTGMSVFFWMKVSKTETTSISAAIFDLESASARFLLTWNTTTGFSLYFFAPGYSAPVTNPKTLVADEWCFICATFDNVTGTLSLYVNNEAPNVSVRGGPVLGATTPAATFRVAESSMYANDVFLSIDELGVYMHEAYSAETVALLFNEDTDPGSPTFGQGLGRTWPLT